MKKILTVVFLLISGIVVSAQQSAQDKHIYQLFESIQNKDVTKYKPLWPDLNIFSDIIISSGNFDARYADNMDTYLESSYYEMMVEVLEKFMEYSEDYSDNNIQNLYIHQTHWNKARSNSENIVEYDGMLWLKSKQDQQLNYLLRFTDIIQHKGKWYGGKLRELEEFDGNFQNAITLTERSSAEEATAAVEAATDAATAAAEAVSEAAMAVDSAAASVELPILEQTTFSTEVNGHKMIINWLVTGWENDKYYHGCTYQYQNQEETTFAETVSLGNGYVLLIEEDRESFFRVKSQKGSLSGTYFSTKTGKEIPVVFKSTEVKR